jgi:molecular chaperone GrpE
VTSPSDLPRGEQSEHEQPVVRDRRRVNPDGSVREPDPAGEAPAASGGPGADAAVAPAPAGPDPQVVELTETLQRLKAEYDNYRRRTDRDRQAVGEAATAQVLAGLLPVLDDVERARTHGDLTGAFAAVGDALTALVAKLGLESYGTAGEPFDPQVHDAVMNAAPAADTDVTIAAEIFRPGYRYAGRVLRPAQVAVAEPAGPAADAAQEESTAG